MTIRRSSIATGLLALILAACGSTPPDPPLDFPDQSLSVRELLDGRDFGSEISRVAVIGGERCVILESNPARLLMYSATEGLSIVASDGPGPAELGGNRFTLSRIPSPRFDGYLPIFLHSIRSPISLAVPPPATDAEILRFRHDRPLVSIAALDHVDVAAIYTSSDPHAALALGGVSDLATLLGPTSARGKQTWPCDRTLGAFRFFGDPALDIARSYYTRLLRRDADSFYRVRLFGEPEVMVLGSDAKPRFEFHITRGGLEPIRPSDGSDLRAWRVLQDVDVDAGGRLHALRGVYVDDDARERYANEILVYEMDGALSRRLHLPTALVAFGVDVSGNRYFGVEANSHRLLQLDINAGAPR